MPPTCVGYCCMSEPSVEIENERACDLLGAWVSFLECILGAQAQVVRPWQTANVNDTKYLTKQSSARAIIYKLVGCWKQFAQIEDLLGDKSVASRAGRSGWPGGLYRLEAAMRGGCFKQENLKIVCKQIARGWTERFKQALWPRNT